MLGYNEDAFKKLQTIRFLDDWAYQANVRSQIEAPCDISESMKAKVREKAVELKYTPNVLARSLVTGKSNFICVVVDSMKSPFFSVIVDELSVTEVLNNLKETLDVEEPIIDRYGNGELELVSYESICFEEGKRKHCYESLEDNPHALGYLNDLLSIDLPSEEQIRIYDNVLKKKEN